MKVRVTDQNGQEHELEGLEGSLTIRIEDGKHIYDLEYGFDTGHG